MELNDTKLEGIIDKDNKTLQPDSNPVGRIDPFAPPEENGEEN